MSVTLILLAVFAALNLVSWAAFRLDKRYARRNERRTPERTLLRLAALGPFGALAAMYLHHHRHKVDKRRFALTVWGLASLWVAVPIAWLVLG